MVSIGFACSSSRGCSCGSLLFQQVLMLSVNRWLHTYADFIVLGEEANKLFIARGALEVMYT
jgi:hypothetical protein